MKRTLQCPKCEGRQIAHVVPVPMGVLGNGEAMPMPLVWRKHRGITINNPYDPIGGYESFICRGCGYSELYAIDHEKLDPAIDKNVRFLDNERKATLR